MPPVITIPSSDEHDDSDVPAFKVLNQDDLPDSIIVGEAIFKPLPFGNEPRKEKPNGIVYPTRRYVGSGLNGNLEENHRRNFTKSNGYIYQQENNNPNNINNNNSMRNPQQNLKKKFSNSHGNLNNHSNSATKRKQEQLLNIDANFTRALDAKLRRLQKEERVKQAANQARV